ADDVAIADLEARVVIAKPRVLRLLADGTELKDAIVGADGGIATNDDVRADAGIRPDDDSGFDDGKRTDRYAFADLGIRVDDGTGIDVDRLVHRAFRPCTPRAPTLWTVADTRASGR